MTLEKRVLYYANKNGNPYATLLDAGFMLWEVRLIMHGYAHCLNIGDLIKFVSKSIQTERNTPMATNNDTFEKCLGKEFALKGSDTIYRFCHLTYGVGQRIEIVGEYDSDGVMNAFIRDPDVVLAQIAKGEMVEVAEVAIIH